MEDLSRKISELLSNPETMEQIKGLTGLLGQTGESSSPPQSQKTENTAMSPVGNMGNMMNPDMLNTVMKIAPLLQSAGNEDDSTRLLRSLKPFLSAERSKRVDGAIRLLGFMKIMPLLKNSGIELFK